MVDQILQWQRWTVFVFTCKHLRPRLNPLEVIVALAILLAGDAKLLHGQPVGVTQKVGPGVIETLQREGAANVVIMLEEPPSMHARRIDLPTLKSEIAGLQYDVDGYSLDSGILK